MKRELFAQRNAEINEASGSVPGPGVTKMKTKTKAWPLLPGKVIV